MLDVAIVEHAPSHVFALFSGGHDSLCSTALAAKHPAFTAAVHINTGVGIEDTRTFVRETCAEQGWPLIEMHPDAKTYADLVAEKGMPYGPKSHNRRALRARLLRRQPARGGVHVERTRGSAAVSEQIWNALGRALMPRWLYHGPLWWRSLNAWWLGWWGAAFFYTDPWRPFRRPR